MKTFAVVSAVALLAAAGAAQGAFQGSMQIRIVPQNRVGSTTTDVGAPGNTVHTTVGAADVGRTRRFEVQYRLIDSNLNDFTDSVVDPDGTPGTGDEFTVRQAITPAGLSACQMNIDVTVGGGTVGMTVARAILSNNEANSIGATWNAPLNPDTGANQANGAAGLHNPLRGGIATGGANPPFPNNANAANGTIGAIPGGQRFGLITPTALSGSGQYSGPIANWTFPNTSPDSITPGQGADGQGIWYGLYSFQVTIGAANLGTDPDNDGFADISITASTVADAQTGNRFGAFVEGDPVPQTSQSATTGTASFRVEIPAPGSLALVGLGGLVAARRRRA